MNPEKSPLNSSAQQEVGVNSFELLGWGVAGYVITYLALSFADFIWNKFKNK